MLTQSLLLSILLTWVGFSFASEQTGIERLQKFNESVNSYRANFSQKIVNDKQKLLEKSYGVMYLQRPGKFRWEYQEPYVHLIVADGAKIWLYDQELETVTVKSLTKGLGDTPAMILSSRRPLTENFYVRDSGIKQKLHWVKLTPKTPSLSFEYISLAFDENGLHAMELMDKLGQTTHIEFSSISINPNLPQQLFRFTPPADVDVVGADG